MADTIVEWFGGGPGSACGYCKSKDTNLSSGMWAHCMSCETYGNLLNRGWRRSGLYCYKPAMDETCCPQYTIRCDITEFKLSKSQKKVLKRFNNFLVSGEKPGTKKDKDGVTIASDCNDDIVVKRPTDTQCESSINLTNIQVESTITQNMDSSKNERNEDIPSSSTVAQKTDTFTKHEAKEDTPTSKTVLGPDPNKPKCRKAKEIRMENKLLKLSKKSETGQENVINVKSKKGSTEKSIEDFIDDLPSEVSHKLHFSLVSVKDKELFEATFNAEFELYCKYQHTVHSDLMEELTQSQFRQFLVDGPLQYVNPTNNNETPTVGLGAFHHQYYLDGKLIAVGVLDILPHCVSSKYFFYDPDYMFLSLGTYSALREIYLIRSLHRDCPAIKYYYMGFYIDSCQKMKYKAKYHPSYLLCPETYIWQPVEKCIPKFSQSKYCRLEDDASKKAPPSPNIDTALILNQNKVMTFKQYVKRLSSRRRLMEAKEIKEFVDLVGFSCSEILLYRSS